MLEVDFGPRAKCTKCCLGKRFGNGIKGPAAAGVEGNNGQATARNADAVALGGAVWPGGGVDEEARPRGGFLSFRNSSNGLDQSCEHGRGMVTPLERGI